MNEVHLVMLRYTMDNSPLDDGGEYAEQVRFAFADRGNAELVANQMEQDTDAPDTLYFVRSHTVMPVVSKQQTK
jgi:hypothetical protein